MNIMLLISTLCWLIPTAGAMGTDDPVLSKVSINKFETHSSDGQRPWVLEAEAWIGTDLNKLWIISDAKWVGRHLATAELELDYSRAIDPNWDMYIGWRGELHAEPKRDWLVLGLFGVAPYQIGLDSSLLVGKSGHVSASMTAEREFMLTQRWVFMPEMTLNLAAQDDEEIGMGAGLSDMNIGLRLGYEINREFMPYIGVDYQQSFGKTADLLRNSAEATHDTQWVIGIKAWF